MIVELKYAGIPFWEMVAVHYWFVTNQAGVRERWEVWHRPNAGGDSIGHLHRNLMHPDSDVGGGPTCLAHRWQGAAAERLAQTLHASWEEYPYRHRYCALPGPNSNTFAAWVLHQAEVGDHLSWRGIGKNFVIRRQEG